MALLRHCLAQEETLLDSRPLHAWKDNRSKRGAQTSIKEMIKMMKTALPRQKGNGWKLQKTHNLFHFVTFIKKFGSVRNFDTACCEKNHTWLSKCPACVPHKNNMEYFYHRLQNGLPIT
jgi:hypothetical protein